MRRSLTLNGLGLYSMLSHAMLCHALHVMLCLDIVCYTMRSLSGVEPFLWLAVFLS